MSHYPQSRGDLWALGGHRLLCGDATDQGDVSRLLGGEPAAMCFTDPPYNVGLGDHGGQQRGQRKRRLKNDAPPPEEWEAFCKGWAKSLLEHVDGALYICMSTKEWPVVSRVLAEAGGHWSDTIIWQKDRFVLGRAPYQRGYEPLWFGWREGVKAHWVPGSDRGHRADHRCRLAIVHLLGGDMPKSWIETLIEPPVLIAGFLLAVGLVSIVAVAATLAYIL